MWATVEELIEDIEAGDEDALEFAEQVGLFDGEEGDEGYYDEGADDEGAEDAYVEALRQEVARVEQQIGRQLTQGEITGMLDTLSTQDVEEQVVPDLLNEFGEELANARNSDAGRIHLGAEAAQRVMDEQRDDSNGIPQPRFEAPDPNQEAGITGPEAE